MEFADTFPMVKKEKSDELFFSYCPYCQGGASKDKDTFSINLEHGTFNCFRSSCGKQGHFVELARDFGFQLDFGEAKQNKPVTQKKIEVRKSAIAYLAKRCIGAEVAKKYGNTKYSGKGNKEWCEAGAKPILFGMAQCEDFTTLVIRQWLCANETADEASKHMEEIGQRELTAVEFAQCKALVDSGYMQPEVLLSRYLGISEEEAVKLMPAKEDGLSFGGDD